MIILNISILSKKKQEHGEKPKKIHREKLIEETIQIDANNLKLSPTVFTEMFPNLKEENIYGFNASIKCERVNIEVSDFEYFTIKSFSNTSPTFSNVKINNINDFCRLNNLKIDRLDANKANFLLVDSKIKKLNVGNLIIHGKSKSDINIDKIDEINTDIRGSKVERLRIFVPSKNIEIKRSYINYISLQRAAESTEKIKVWQNSDVDRFKIFGYINDFEVSNSNLNDLEFTKSSFIKKFKIESSIIKRTHNCFFESIDEINMDTLQLIIDSAKNNNDHKRYTEASFEYMKLKSKNNEKISSKLMSKIMKCTCGYGYKPLRPILASIVVWIIFGLSYWILSIFNYGGIDFSGGIIQKLGSSLYLSIITFTTTGFGDILPMGFIAKTLSGIESILGIVLASLFIFTLTKRFGNLY